MGGWECDFPLEETTALQRLLTYFLIPFLRSFSGTSPSAHRRRPERRFGRAFWGNLLQGASISENHRAGIHVAPCRSQPGSGQAGRFS